MTGKTHQAIGFAAASTLYFYQHPAQPLTWAIAATVIVGSFIGSLLPDIDQPTANFWQSIPLGSLGRGVVPRALGGHRHISHSLLGALLFYGISATVTTYLLSGNIDHVLLLDSLLAGFLAHLAADSLTVQGIPLFWPLYRSFGFPPFPFQGLRIVTGKWFENFVILPVSFLLIGFILLSHQSALCSIIPLLCSR